MEDDSDYDEDVDTDFDPSEWEDVEPVPQHDSENPVVAIAYTDYFVEVHSYLRAVIKSGEMSSRVYRLTKAVIECNPANYTAWKHRRDVLIAIKGDIIAELAAIAEMLVMYPKNFQIWHHRRELLTHHKHHADELLVVNKTLSKDAKNYHAWAHRRWAVVTFDLIDGEEEYAKQLIDDDFRNNSAWNYLFFLIETRDLGLNPQARTRDVDVEEHISVRKREIERALQYLKFSPSNESVHNIIIGHLLPKAHREAVFKALAPTVAASLLPFDDKAQVWTKATLAEIYTTALKYGMDASDLPLDGASFKDKINSLYASLCDLDGIRKKYWMSLLIPEPAP